MRDRVSCTAAAGNAVVASKADSGSNISTATVVGAQVDELDASAMPATTAATTLAPTAAVGVAAATAAGAAARSIACPQSC